jgi:hypothetical protein
LVGCVEQPSISCPGREKDQLTNRDKAPVMIGGLTLDVTDLVGKAEAFTLDPLLSRSTLDRSAAHRYVSSPRV